MANKHPLKPDESQMVQLFQQLSVEQCIELFKQNYDNYSPLLKNRLYVVIGAKTVWGEVYTPNKNYKERQKQK